MRQGIDTAAAGVITEQGGAGDVAYTKKFAKWIAAESTKTIADEKALALFKKIKLVVSDEANVVSSDVADRRFL